MSEIKIHILHTGSVCVAPDLPFGGEHCNPLKASGLFGGKKTVSGFLYLHILLKVLTVKFFLIQAGTVT